MWKYGCPKIPVWSADGLEEQRGEDASSVEYYVHNVDSLDVAGQSWSSEVISLSLEDWEVGRVALSCHLSMDLLRQEMRDACWESSECLDAVRSLCSECQEGRRRKPSGGTVTAVKPFSHRGGAATTREIIW